MRLRLAGAWFATLLLAGCAGHVDTRSEVVPPLIVPPDLSRPANDESLAVPTLGNASVTDNGTSVSATPSTPVLPASGAARLVRAGDERWLVVNAPAEQVWPQVRDFFVNNGMRLHVEDPTLGVLETDWVDTGPQGAGNVFQRAFGETARYTAPTQDKFRVRLERGQAPGTTEIYVADRGIVRASDGGWKARASDPGLEAEVLQRLLVQLGESSAAAQAVMAAPASTPRAQLQTVGGHAALLLADGLDEAWSRTTIALERVGLSIENQDRSKGVYRVRYNPATHRGFWARIFTKSAPVQRYQAVLTASGTGTELQLLDENGATLPDSVAEPWLQRLLSELR